MEKTFTVAGTSIHKDQISVRFANDTGRVKVLEKNGHERVHLIELERPMTKLEAARTLLTIELFADEQDQDVILDFIAKEESKVKVKKRVVDVDLRIDDIEDIDMSDSVVEAEVIEDLEDQPF